MHNCAYAVRVYQDWFSRSLLTYDSLVLLCFCLYYNLQLASGAMPGTGPPTQAAYLEQERDFTLQ